MKISVFIALLLAMLLYTPAMADSGAANPCAVNPCAANPCAADMGKGHMRGQHKGRYMKMMKEHSGMMREVLTILRDLNKRPTKAQKQRLGEMIDRLDEMEKKMMEKMEKMQDKRKMGM